MLGFTFSIPRSHVVAVARECPLGRSWIDNSVDTQTQSVALGLYNPEDRAVVSVGSVL